MTETKTLLLNATGLFGKISRAYENLMKLGEAKITLGAVEARLHNLERLWEKFDAINDELADRLEEIKGEVYAKQDVPALAEEAYLQNKGLMLDLKSTLQRQQPGPDATAAGTPGPAPQPALPKIQPPTFTGKYEDWPSFRDLFQSVIGRNTAAKPVDKMHYLKLSVKGDASLLIRNLSTTEDNYEIAWKTLSDYYENKRLLTRSYLINFLALTKMKGESAAELRRIFHGIKTTVSSLKSIDRPIDRTADLFVHLVVELLDNHSRREWESDISHTTNPPTYNELEAFIERQLHTLEALFPAKNDSPASNTTHSSNAKRSHHARRLESREKSRGRCSLCQGDHFVMFCDEYKKKTAVARKQHVAAQNLCANCLGRHLINECASKRNCTACGGRHHSSLHDAFREVGSTATAHVAQGSVSPPMTVLLATARVRILDSHGIWHAARALVDQSSETSIISERLTQRLRLPRTSASVTVYGLGEKRTGVSKGRVALTIQSLNCGPAISFDALVLPKLTLYSGGYRGSMQSWAHLQDLELADPEFRSSDPVDILLGADVYSLIIRQGLKKGDLQEPVAQQTSLGWILSGTVVDSATRQPTFSHRCHVEEDVNCLVRRFWEQEELSRSSPIFSKADQECEKHFRRHHSRTADGRYIVRLPTIEPLPDLSGTRRSASLALQHKKV